MSNVNIGVVPHLQSSPQTPQGNQPVGGQGNQPGGGRITKKGDKYIIPCPYKTTVYGDMGSTRILVIEQAQNLPADLIRMYIKLKDPFGFDFEEVYVGTPPQGDIEAIIKSNDKKAKFLLDQKLLHYMCDTGCVREVSEYTNVHTSFVSEDGVTFTFQGVSYKLKVKKVQYNSSCTAMVTCRLETEDEREARLKKEKKAELEEAKRQKSLNDFWRRYLEGLRETMKVKPPWF